MPSPTKSFVDALCDEQLCPLCFELYPAADDALCEICDGSACPSCMECLEPSGALRCIDCRPVAHPAPLATLSGDHVVPRPTYVARESAESGVTAALAPLTLPTPRAAYTPFMPPAQFPDMAPGRPALASPPPLPNARPRTAPPPLPATRKHALSGLRPHWNAQRLAVLRARAGASFAVYLAAFRRIARELALRTAASAGAGQRWLRATALASTRQPLAERARRAFPRFAIQLRSFARVQRLHSRLALRKSRRSARFVRRLVQALGRKVLTRAPQLR